LFWFVVVIFVVDGGVGVDDADVVCGIYVVIVGVVDVSMFYY